MAATSHPLSTQTAIKILQQGGNAMDAAIAACAVQCVVEPESTGIGGDCFCLYAPQGSADVVAFNGSGRAPGAATLEALAERGVTAIDRHSPHCVTIPGAIDAWTRLLSDHGTMSLGAVLEPAIAYAENGFPVSSRVHSDFSLQAPFLRDDPVSASVYLPGNAPPAVGSVLRLPQLARSLTAIAEEGRDVFYQGWIARDIVEHLQSLGGLHTMQDFADAAGEYVSPISADFRGKTVLQCPPNGQGVIALLLLNMFEKLEIDADGPLALQRIHTEIEACRLAYAARNQYVGDPAFGHSSVEGLLSGRYAEQLVAAIDPSRAVVPPPQFGLPVHRDTVYISVVDKDRNACSFINSLFHNFGSGITAPVSGVTLHNRGQGFVLEKGHPNCIEPGKRPLHTLMPGMIVGEGRAVMSYGVMGGQYQAFGHMQFLTRHFDFGLDLQEAMDLPRYMVEPVTGRVDMENAIGPELRAELERRGHQIATPVAPIGGSQAIAIDWDNNVLTGASDPRKDGCALGY
jgi:gamma-glutamyltranspeptidase/glutathione hydrolase